MSFILHVITILLAIIVAVALLPFQIILLPFIIFSRLQERTGFLSEI